MRGRPVVVRLGSQLLVAFALLGLWEGVLALHVLKPLVARTPVEVARSLVTLLGEGLLWSSLGSTLSASLVAFALAAAVGIPAGLVLGAWPRLEGALSPYLDGLYGMPRIGFAPLLVVVFGVGMAVKVALAFTVVVLLIVISTRAGVRVMDRDIVMLARSMGVSRLTQFRKVMIPTAIPSIFAGLRVGMIYSLMGVVTQEMIAAKSGMGVLITEDSNIFRISDVYALLVILGVTAALLNAGILRIERHFLRWQRVDSIV